jgi:hypothetical protein
MTEEIKEILEHLSATQKINNGWTSFSVEECKGLYDYIINLEKISNIRMKTLLKIEQYCIDEKEDLISGGEVCEDVLKIIDELKGK